jgi:hypothetical protein
MLRDLLGRGIKMDKKFAYHKPSEEGLRKITILRENFSELNRLIELHAYNSREKSVALTQLETAAMWAIKAVVSNDPDSEVEGV